MVVEWHPKQLAEPVEWHLVYMHAPIGVVRKLTIEDQTVWRAVTWARTSEGRTLIGYFETGDEAAKAIWARLLEQSRGQHQQASRRKPFAGRPD